MKKIILLFTCLIFSALIPFFAYAEETEAEFVFDTAINGAHEVYAGPGDILTVNVTLKRTDAAVEYTMYAMQDEIRYDDTFLEIIDGSLLTVDGIVNTDIALLDGDRAFYLNFLSLSGGVTWKPEVFIGSFQVRVLAEKGSTILKNEECQVSLPDGSDSYPVSVENVKIIVSTDCVVRFEPGSGMAAWETTAVLGSHIDRPEITREGYHIRGWYKDPDLTEEWSFANDRVESDMVLYAGWEENTAASGSGISGGTAGDKDIMLFGVLGVSEEDMIAASVIVFLLIAVLILLLIFRRKTVTFVNDDGTKIRKIRVRKGSKLDWPEIPEKEGMTFVGWYRDEEKLKRWIFEEDKVESNITLYAKWY